MSGMRNMEGAVDVGRWKLKRHVEDDVRRWKPKKQRFCTSPSLPHDIIENMILSRLPVKDLVRYRVVCKQWEATISDPTFAEIHLQHNKNRNLLAWEYLRPGFHGLVVVELRNNCFELVPAIEHSRDYRLGFGDTTWCSCDGLYLRFYHYIEQEGEPVKCVLWNPSRRMYREIYCPPSVDARRSARPARAIYYDPLMKDYKIVIADMDHYAVYTCRDNKWGDVKEMKGFLGDYCSKEGVFVNGSIYWVVNDLVDEDYIFREIICFDCKDESFKILPLPKLENRDEYDFKLTSFGGQLCLFISETESYRIKIMKKVNSANGNDEWMESKEECLCEYLAEPVCPVSENELLFHVFDDEREARRGMVYKLYDKSKNTVVNIHNSHPTSYLKPIAHLENLFLL